MDTVTSVSSLWDTLYKENQLLGFCWVISGHKLSKSVLVNYFHLLLLACTEELAICLREGVTAVEEPKDCPNISKISCRYAAIFQEFLQTSSLPIWNRMNNSGFWRQLTVYLHWLCYLFVLIYNYSLYVWANKFNFWTVSLNSTASKEHVAVDL